MARWRPFRLSFWWIYRAQRRIRSRRVEEKKDREAAVQPCLESIAKPENVAPIWRLPNGEGIAGRDLALLVQGKWLNSEIINSYFSLLKVRSDRLCENGSSKLRVHCFSSFFYTKLQIAGYEGVRRWTKKTVSLYSILTNLLSLSNWHLFHLPDVAIFQNIFEHDLLLFPINHDNVHWSLVAAYVNKKRIEYYDSLLCESKTKSYFRVMALIDQYLGDERLSKGIGKIKTKMEVYVVDSVPQQIDGWSCGVFICAYADHLTRGQSSPFSFSSRDVSTIQSKMASQMLQGSIP